MAGPISGVGQHVPAYSGACLKDRRLVTSLGPIFGKMPSSKCSIFLSHHFQRASFKLIYFRNSSCHMSVHRLMNSAEQHKCFKYACCESCRKFLCGSNKRNIPGTILHSWWSTTTVYYWISYIGQYEYEYSVFLCDNLVNFPHQLPKLPS